MPDVAGKMTREEAVEILLVQPKWLPCPRASERPAPKRTKGGWFVGVCPACGGSGSHMELENPIYALACHVLGLESPQEEWGRLIHKALGVKL